MAIAPSDITAANSRTPGFLKERSVNDVAAVNSGPVEPWYEHIIFVEKQASVGGDQTLGAPLFDRKLNPPNRPTVLRDCPR